MTGDCWSPIIDNDHLTLDEAYAVQQAILAARLTGDVIQSRVEPEIALVLVRRSVL